MNASTGKVPILLTDAGYRNTLAAARSLSEAGYVVDAIGPPGSCCERSKHLRHLVDPRFLSNIDGLCELLEQQRYAALLPIGARSVEVIARNAKRISTHTHLALHDADTIERCMDKHQLNSHAESVGLNVPPWWCLDTEEDARRVADEATFPIVIKKRHELDRRPLFIAGSARTFLDNRSRWQTKNAPQRFAPIAQECIEGDGCAFFGLYDHGELKRWFMHRRIREFPAAGGASSCAESAYEQDVFDAGKRLLDSLNWHGVAMVEFKRQRATGQLQLMEVNPKFWGSLDLAIAAGVNFPVETVRLALGEPLEPQRDYAVGLRFHWPFGHGEWLHVVQRPRSAFGVLRDCLNPRVRTNVRWNDMGPTFSEMRQDLRVLRRGRVTA